MTLALFLLLALQVTPELRQHVDAGLKAKAAGDLDTAIREFKRVVDLAPQLPAAHVNLGAVYYEKKAYAEAVPSLEKALELDPNLPGAHAMLGAALLAQGYLAASIPHLEKAQSDDLLGVALLESNRPREALLHLEAALAQRPEDPDLLYYVGIAHTKLSKQAFDRLQQTSPDSARARQMMGEAMAATGNREGAERKFRASLALRPDLRGVHFAIGELELAAGNYDRAEAEFRAEVQLAPGSAAAAYKLGAVLANRGRTTEAIAELKKADALQPGMPETLLELGKAMNTAGDPKSASTYLEQVLQSEQKGDLAEAAHFQLAQAYRKLGRTADADREIKLFQSSRSVRKTK
jgi:tetratricopeptide (TPR) repeat protein